VFFEDARREIARDLGLMVEEGVISAAAPEAALSRIVTLAGVEALEGGRFIQEALPEDLDLKRRTLAGPAGPGAPDAIIAAPSSTISPSHLVDWVARAERFLVAHWLNPAHIIPLVEVVPGPKTAPEVVEHTMALLEGLGKVPVRCGDSPGFIGPRLQVLLM